MFLKNSGSEGVGWFDVLLEYWRKEYGVPEKSATHWTSENQAAKQTFLRRQHGDKLVALFTDVTEFALPLSSEMLSQAPNISQKPIPAAGVFGAGFSCTSICRTTFSQGPV